MNDKVYANYLMHGRTKGSRNGISTTKGYTAVGQKAKGKLVNGKYVYANNNENTQSGIVVKPTSNNWQQQAELERWKKQNRNNIAAKKTADAKAQAAKDAAWNAKVQVAKKPTNIGASQAGNTARAMKEYMTKASAERKAKRDGIKKGDNQMAAYAQEQARLKNNAFSKAKSNAKNDWQNQANTQRAMKEYMTKASAERKAESAKRSASYNKMSSTQKNAMQNDPRYRTGFREIKDKNGKVVATYSHSPLMSTPNGRTKYDYSGKNDDRAPTFTALGKKPEKMNRDPYFNEWANASNKQEEAKAIAGNKAFMNSFRESKIRNSRSDLGNAIADAKEDAKNAFKSLKNKFKKKKKK